MSGHIGARLALGVAVLLVAAPQAPEAENAARLHEVAAEGDVLDDGTILETIEWQCGSNQSYRPCIAIGAFGRVAFYGTIGSGVAAILTQRRSVVEDGELLPDGSSPTIDASTIVGGLSSDGLWRLAFPALDDGTRALFMPSGLVVKQGDMLPDGTSASINFLGGLATNLRGDVAFHGSNAVFTQDGRVARARDTLADGTVVDGISFFGSVATGGWRDQVAFHGFTDNRQAIFDRDGVVVEIGELPDGTRLDWIDLVGRLAIGRDGRVVFHGRTDGHDAVFSQHGLIARTGDTLPDGTVLEEIRAEGGIAIDRRGVVVFHGVAHGRGALFTQHGLLVEEGDRLADGNRLERIRAAGGVAIDFRGHVAFHGEVAGKGAVLVARSGGGRHRDR